MTATARLTRFIGDLWHTDRPLTLTGLLMIGALGVFGVGLLVDPRTVGGAPVWLKPAKFAASLIVEIVIIAAQAARGTTSHFNVGTPLDATLFAIMGVTIVVQTLLSIAVAVALWRQPFANAALGWALRLGLVITIAGASLGGVMTRPTGDQLAAARATGRMPLAGAHTIGAVDGGPGLPGTGWSVDHGDMRVPHFMGLHALQVLPIVAWLIQRRGWKAAATVRAVQSMAASYAALVSILVWQALRGQSLVRPDTLTLTALAVWAVATLVAITAASTLRNGVGHALPARG
jgi:hypothetical protein